MQLHPTIKLLEHITAALLVKECRPIEPDFCGCLMVGRITTAHTTIQNKILTVCHANKWRHIPRIKLVELKPFSFASTIYTTFFRECRPIEPDFCSRIMAGFILGSLPHPDPRSCLLIPFSGFKPANQTKKLFD